MRERRLHQAVQADRILTHYVVMALKAAGVNVDNDVYAELNGLLQAAINEAVDVAVAEALAAVAGRDADPEAGG